MADVKIVDIDTEQWNIKDQYARDLISALESRLNGYKTIRHDIKANPPQETNNIWSCLINQITATDWSFITDGIYAYGQFVITTVGWGQYKALRFPDNALVLSGVLEYGIEPHTFEAVYYPPSNAWRFNIDGEGLSYLQNGILITYKMGRVNNGFGVPTEIFVRNTVQTPIGSLYEALKINGLLNRPSAGVITWDLQRYHNGVDLPKGRLGNPAYASTQEFDFSGRVYLINPRMNTIDEQNNSWICTWNDGNVWCEANMFGEPNTGIVQSVSITFTV